MNRLNIQPDAIADSEEAAGWYENQQPGLGVEFILELDAAFEKVAENPAIYEIQYREVRRILLHRFPYSVYFVYENSAAEVFHVASTKVSYCMADQNKIMGMTRRCS